MCVATHMNVFSCILFNSMYMHRESLPIYSFTRKTMICGSGVRVGV